jgi:spore maturation protein SpmA/spore maturation protein SpmB
MVLNRIWVGMFVIAILMGICKLIFWQDIHILQNMMDALFNSSKLGFEISLFMTGTLCLWMGFMKIGEDGGAIRIMTKLISPLFSKLFPEVPKDHPAIGSMMMNFSANMLGLDNAATPVGLKAMKDLQSLNPNPKVATNAQIMFLVLNASGLTIIPVSILAARVSAESTSPASVFLPILITTFFATLGGLIFVSIKQKINLLNKVILAYVGSLCAMVFGLIWVLNAYPEKIDVISSVVSNLIIFGMIAFFFTLAIRSKIQVFEVFIEGAKGGFEVAMNIVPYLIAMLVAVALFRASGAFDELIHGIKYCLFFLGLKLVEFVDVLPVLFMKPFSGSGARGLMVEAFGQYGVDSFRGNLASTFQGSTETTFYVLSIYFGAVKITNSRYAATAGLFCDLIGGIAAVLVAYLFYN